MSEKEQTPSGEKAGGDHEKPNEKKAEGTPQAEEKKEEKPKEHHEKKRKKISRMKLQEVETELKVLQEKMGGFQSNFAQHLLARKKELQS